MSDRDELDELRGFFWIELQDIAAKQEAIPDDVYWLNLAAAAANAVHKAGWRRSTVTPEQVDAAATAIADYVGGIAWGRDVVSVVARQLGLSVAEDGEQSPLEQLRRQHLDHAAIREALERADGEWDEETGDGPANPLYLDQLTAAVTAKWNQA